MNLDLYRLTILAKPIKLILKRSFNTAHSSSLTRINFFFKISWKSFDDKQNHNDSQKNINGFGQCGLPPKKTNCYLADISDCQQFFKLLSDQFVLFNQQLKKQKFQIKILKKKLQDSYIQILEQYLKKDSKALYFDFLKLKFQDLIQSQETDQILVKTYFYVQIIQLIKTAKSLSLQRQQFKAARSALEFAILDLIGKVQNKFVSEIISINPNKQNKKQCYSFYTISHEENLDSMIQNAKQSLCYTSFIKIKFNNDIEKLIELLVQMDKNKIGNKWIIDANASWNPQDFIHFQQLVNLLQNKKCQIRQKILFIQQPFPIFQSLIGQKNINEITQLQKKWQSIKTNTKFIIIADQSFISIKSFQKVRKFSHGVNIKMQKCGGPLQTAKILQYIEQNGIQHYMFGSMVSTHLGCTQTFQFHNFGQYFDIDGALLVKQPQIHGGFEWKGEKGIEKVGGFGLGLDQKDIQRYFG